MKQLPFKSMQAKKGNTSFLNVQEQSYKNSENSARKSHMVTKLSEKKNKTALIKAISGGNKGNQKWFYKAKSMWRSQDLFGKEVQFTYKGKRAYQTSIGAFVSIIIKIILGFFIFYEFYTIFSRKHPAMATITTLNDDSEGKFNPYENGFVTGFALRQLTNISTSESDYQRYLLIDEQYGSIKVSQSSRLELTNLDFSPCTEATFNSVSTVLIEDILTHKALQCIDDPSSLKLSSPLFSVDPSQITISVHQCVNSSSLTCHSSDDIVQYFSNLQLIVYYQNVNFNSKQFEEGKMLEYYIDEPLVINLGQSNRVDLSIQLASTEMYDGYLQYWLKHQLRFARVDKIQKQATSENLGEVRIRGSTTKVIYMRVADNIFSGLESIGGFFESLMHIGAILVAFFQERLFKGSFLKQLYQITTDVVLTNQVDEKKMIKQADNVDKIDENYIKSLLDFIVLKRERFHYGAKNIVDYISRCICFRKPSDLIQTAENKPHFLYKKGNEKLKQELDIVNLVRQIRQLRLMAQVLLKPSERLLLKFQRKNVIETTSSSSDSDHQNYDTVKLLNSKKGLVKLSQIVKINKMLVQYKDRELKPIERNLFKGIFLRRPAKPLLQVKESEEEESQSSFNSSFASDFTNNINNKYSQDKPSQRIKSVRERSYEVTEEYDDGNDDFTQQEVNIPYFPTVQRDDMEMASQKLHKIKQPKLTNDSEQVNNHSQSHSNNNEFDSFHRGSSKSSKKVTIRKKILSQGQVSWGNLAMAQAKAPIGLSKFRKHSQIVVTQPQPRQNIDYSHNEFSDRSVITSISSLNPSRHSKQQSSLVPITKPRHISQMNVLQEQFTDKRSVGRGATSSNSRPVVQRVQQQREHSSNMTDRAHPHLDDADTERKLASSNIKRNESFRIQDSSNEEVESQVEAGDEEISFRKVDKGKKRMVIYH
ncbi:hypothetical protein FGO68_gene14121 [Halteria grandinella]|uniref:Uncharacterized protein n=1 Tax=Halteria grandinella TaxID=5974 RepID=A0A8J8NZB6_HALGN|nr:hypothetical protein FGO68_gene14121 [Halteria grandinella]